MLYFYVVVLLLFCTDFNSYSSSKHSRTRAVAAVIDVCWSEWNKKDDLELFAVIRGNFSHKKHTNISNMLTTAAIFYSHCPDLFTVMYDTFV